MKNLDQPQRLNKSSSVRTRFTPTFYHHDIFGNIKEGNLHQYVRITPTFHSTVFAHETGIPQNQRPKSTRHKENVNRTQDNNYHIYTNQSRQRKQAQLYPCRPQTGNSINQRFRDEKQKISQEINHTDGRTSRMRKCVEQMSNPIFGGYLWNPSFQRQEKKQKQRVYSPDNYRHNKNENQIAKEKGQHNQQRQQIGQKQQKQIILTEKIINKQKDVPKKDQSKKANSKKQQKQLKPKPNTKHSNNMKKFKSSCNLHSKPKHK